MILWKPPREVSYPWGCLWNTHIPKSHLRQAEWQTLWVRRVWQLVPKTTPKSSASAVSVWCPPLSGEACATPPWSAPALWLLRPIEWRGNGVLKLPSQALIRPDHFELPFTKPSVPHRREGSREVLGAEMPQGGAPWPQTSDRATAVSVTANAWDTRGRAVTDPPVRSSHFW